MTTIQEALEQLDHSNDKHWTQNGTPRISVVREFAGDDSITTKDIESFKVSRNDSNEEKGNEVSDVDIENMTADEVIATDDVEIQKRFVEIHREKIARAIARQKDNREAEIRHTKIVVPVEKHLEFESWEDRQKQDNADMDNWLKAQIKNREDRAEFINNLNLTKDQRNRAFATPGKLNEKIIKSL